MNKLNRRFGFWQYYLPVFILFSISVLIFQYNREKRYKEELFENKLSDYNSMVFNFLENSGSDLTVVDSIISKSPYSDIRFTIIDLNGQVVYDNVIEDISKMENHLNRNEIIQAKKFGKGSDVRISQTNNTRYFYFTNRFDNCYIRSSIVYDMNFKSILSPDNLFFYFWLLMTFLLVSILFYSSNRFAIKIQREQIEHDSKTRRQLSQQVAHELKTPLSSIIGYMETLHNNQNISEERKRFFIDRSHSQAIRLNELLQDILLLNQLNEAPKTVRKEPVLLNKVIANVVEDVSLTLEAKNIQVNISLGDDIWLKANHQLIYSIFRNLIDNVIEYSGENIQVQILLLKEDAKYFHFQFSDNGVGVNQESIPYLFDRFYRVDKGRSRKTGGTGLGLAIVKNAIEFHNGSISVKNNENGGLMYIFTLQK